jgi:prepilin-type N-terminal cleavage/methylation domain-containing protein
MNAQPRPACRRGFTLIELLVVIGIIAVLMSILIPVIGNVKKQSYNTATMSRINAIAQGIEQYRQVFEAYPGPLADNQLSISTTPGTGLTNNAAANAGGATTSSQNLVLGLLGGLQLVGSNVNFNNGLVGKGPQSLNPLKVQTYQTFVDSKVAGLDEVKSGNNWIPWANGAHTVFPFQSSIKDVSPATTAATPTKKPEFVDAFPDPMPILYIRATLGATGVVTDGTTVFPKSTVAAYDMRQLYPYTFAQLPIPTNNPPTYSPLMTSSSPVNPLTKKYIELYANQYFGTPAPNNDQPRQKEAYLLISAGIDRMYGTKDDATNSGTH